MFRVYKRTIQIGSQRPIGVSDTNTYRVGETVSVHKLPMFLTVPLMLVGTVVATALFSMFFVLLLIPMGIVGFKAWRLMKKTQNQTLDQTIEAEYTVISEDKK